MGRLSRARRIIPLLIPLLVAIAVGVAYASVFVGYPVTLVAQPVTNDVKITLGSNANSQDLQGNIIQVDVGPNRASAQITVHPTYGVNYYSDIIRINNTSPDQVYYLWFKTTNQSGWPAGSDVRIVLRDPSTGSAFYVASLLTDTLTWSGGIQLNNATYYIVDFYISIPEGVTLPSNMTLEFWIAWTPSASETPPSDVFPTGTP